MVSSSSPSFRAFSQNLSITIIFRALQGITGGALIPLAALTSISSCCRRDKRPDLAWLASALTATISPALGPTLSGYFHTDNYGWQWIFFINLVPGLVMIALIWIFLPCDDMHLEKLRDFDYFGVITMGIGLGCLEYVLEEGQRKDWFGNEIILRCTWVAVDFHSAFFSSVN